MMEETQSRARVEKLAYRVPGTHSVPAQPTAAEIGWRGHGSGPGAGEPEGQPAASERLSGETLRAAITALEQRLRESETWAAAEGERLRREGGERVEQARRQAEEDNRALRERMAQQVASALASFHREREEYFAAVEREVVRLALAIAARILHREALLDPLLLAGAVRVALGQLGETTGVRLRCPAEQCGPWKELLAGLAPAPDIVSDPAMKPGECVLEARVGSVDLGVRAQLDEIERGFFDLLERRPGAGGALFPEPEGQPAPK